MLGCPLLKILSGLSIQSLPAWDAAALLVSSLAVRQPATDSSLEDSEENRADTSRQKRSKMLATRRAMKPLAV